MVKKTDFFPPLSSVFQVQAVLKRKEEEDQQMKQMVQTLQLALEKEKTKVKDLKEQVGAQRRASGCRMLCQLHIIFIFAFQMIQKSHF